MKRRKSRIALEIKKQALSNAPNKNVDHLLNEMLGQREERQKKVETFQKMRCEQCQTQNAFGEQFTIKPRRFAKCAWILPDKMCVFGGESDAFSGDVRRDLYSFNVTTKVWNFLTPFPGKGRTKHSMICREMSDVDSWQQHFDFKVFAKELIVFGGQKEFTESTNEVLAYNFDLLKWRVVPCAPSTRTGSSKERLSQPLVPPPVHSHTALYLRDQNAMLVFGGENAGSFTNNHVFILDFTSNDQFEWRLVRPKNAENPIPSRSQHSALLYDNDSTMIVFGGFSNIPKKGICYLNDTWKYDIEKNTWELLEVTGTLPAPRFGHAATLWKNYMYVFGGGVPFMPGLFRLNLNNNVWEEILILNRAPSPRYGHIMYSRSKRHPVLYVMGGSGYEFVETEQHVAYYDDLHELVFPRAKAVKDISDYSRIDNHYESLDEVAQALRKAGLHQANLIIGIDYTFSNTYQGEKTFGGKNLHQITPGVMNPYQQVISIIGRTLQSFDDDGIIPVFGFGDIRSTDKSVFRLSPEGKMDPCGFEEVLETYNLVTPTVKMSGPTNFAPLIKQAISMVQESKEYTILLIIADGQVTEESQTLAALVEASHYPLSMVLVGVGDGPFDAAQVMDDRVRGRLFDNFQFVDFSEICAEAVEKEENLDIVFALNCLMEVPDQYSALQMLGIVKRKIGLDDDSDDDEG